MSFPDIKSKLIDTSSMEVLGRFSYSSLFEADDNNTCIQKLNISFFLLSFFKESLDTLFLEHDHDTYFLSTDKNISFLTEINDNLDFKEKFKELFNLNIESINFFEIDTVSTDKISYLSTYKLFIDFDEPIADLNNLSENANDILNLLKEKIKSFNLPNNSDYFQFLKLNDRDFIHDFLDEKTYTKILIPYIYFDEFRDLLFVNGILFKTKLISHHSGDFIEVNMLLHNTFKES